jgi:hypothetical protein
MRARTPPISFPVMAVLLLVTASCIAHDKGKWVERMKCGEVRYQIESDCKKSMDPDTLNDCKSQLLRITYRDWVFNERLPQLDKATVKGIKETGGEIGDLFVTQWACVQADKGEVAVLYYSVGGGSAPYADAYTVYDTEGKRIDDDENSTIRAALANREKSMRRVKSIMPD